MAAMATIVASTGGSHTARRREARVALEMLTSIGAIETRRADEAIRLHDRVCAMIWRLMESRR
jgi:hypothetical protein